MNNAYESGQTAKNALEVVEPSVSPSLRRFFSHLSEDAPAYDFYYTMRFIDASTPGEHPLGRAPLPKLEPIRLSQYPSLTFAPATLHSYKDGASAYGTGRLSVHHFGLFGPNGALPQHLTEYVQERVLHHKDESMLRFCDIFQHRMILLSYRAWADAQSAPSLDHAARDHFTRYVSSLVGLGQQTLKHRDSVPDHLKLHHAGHLVRMSRNPDGLAQALAALVRNPIRVKEYCLQWLRVAERDQTRLGNATRAGEGAKRPIELGNSSSQLGMGAIAGAKMPDVQHKFRLLIGPMRLSDFERFLPGGDRFLQVRDWVRNYNGVEFAWDAQIILKKEEIPATSLGRYGRLGWTSWLGAPASLRKRDSDDVILDIERLTALRGAKFEHAISPP